MAEQSTFEPFEAPNGTKKLRCRLTGHEIPDRPDAISAHLASRRYRLASARVSNDALATYAEHYIVPSKNGGHGRGILYCTLTKTHLNAVKEELDAHIQGRRYKAALERIKARGKQPKAEGEESSEEEDEGDDEEREEGSDEELPEQLEMEKKEEKKNAGKRATEAAIAPSKEKKACNQERELPAAAAPVKEQTQVDKKKRKVPEKEEAEVEEKVEPKPEKNVKHKAQEGKSKSEQKRAATTAAVKQADDDEGFEEVPAAVRPAQVSRGRAAAESDSEEEKTHVKRIFG